MIVDILTDEALTMRAPSMADVEIAAALMNATALAEQGSVIVDVPYVERDWQTPGFNLETDARLLFAPLGEPIGYVEVWDSPPHVRPYIWGCVHPDYQGCGIGGYLMNWAEARAAEALDRAPEGARVSLRVNALSTNRAEAALLSARGYHVVRHYWRMQRDLDPDITPDIPLWPDGITIRPYAPKVDDRFVYQAVQEAFRDHWGFVDRPFDEWRHHMTATRFDASLWFLAVTTESGGDEIAGVALCRAGCPDDPDIGWVGTLAVRRAWRRQGIGQALLQYAFGEFHRRGMFRVGLGVDSGNLTGATRLYERAGLHTVRQIDTYDRLLRDGEEITMQGQSV